MTIYPAIALLELPSIAAGIYCADEMIKRSPINVIKSGTSHNGKYIILIGGTVASTEEAFQVGRALAKEDLLDQLFLPDVHEQVYDAILGMRGKCSKESIGIIETLTAAATVKSTDAAIKGANIDIVEIRLADHLGGKAFSILSGEIEDVQSAIQKAKENVTHENYWIRGVVIPHLHYELAGQIEQSTYFCDLDLRQLEEGELKCS
jgi:microcompartment protein CcmL/EutN